MELVAIEDLNKENKSVTLKMSFTEAAYITKLIGGFSESSDPTGKHKIGSEIYDCLTGELFNRFYEDGVRDFKL